MWLLIECDDPVAGPGRNENRRFFINRFNEGYIKQITKDGSGIEVHPATQWHRGITDEVEIIAEVAKLRKKFEYMAHRKMYMMHRSERSGEYTSSPTFNLWAGYWECAVENGIIPDLIEYINKG
ncbi:MAG: hypothetical protein HF975_04260 [ANME-2 cluster archaeon]|nr:hypothetical protein [ANME-2 cluster archaeon]